jgi:hypothetical protein
MNSQLHNSAFNRHVTSIWTASYPTAPSISMWQACEQPVTQQQLQSACDKHMNSQLHNSAFNRQVTSILTAGYTTATSIGMWKAYQQPVTQQHLQSAYDKHMNSQLHNSDFNRHVTSIWTASYTTAPTFGVTGQWITSCKTKNGIFLDVTARDFCKNRLYGGTYRHSLQGEESAARDNISNNC